LENFKAAYDNKAFTLSHCCHQGLKKWEDSFARWQQLEKKKVKGNDNTSTGDFINLDA
jgi:hypothetical protein